MLHGLRRWRELIKLKRQRADFLLTLDCTSIVDLNAVERKLQEKFPGTNNQTDELAHIWDSTPDEVRTQFLLDPVGEEVAIEGEDMWEMERSSRYKNDYIPTAALCKSRMCGGRCRCSIVPQRSVEDDIVEYYRDDPVDKLKENYDDESLQEAIRLVEKDIEATEKQHKEVQAVIEDWGVTHMLQDRKKGVDKRNRVFWSSLFFKKWRRNVGLKICEECYEWKDNVNYCVLRQRDLCNGCDESTPDGYTSSGSLRRNHVADDGSDAEEEEDAVEEVPEDESGYETDREDCILKVGSKTLTCNDLWDLNKRFGMSGGKDRLWKNYPGTAKFKMKQLTQNSLETADRSWLMFNKEVAETMIALRSEEVNRRNEEIRSARKPASTKPKKKGIKRRRLGAEVDITGVAATIATSKSNTTQFDEASTTVVLDSCEKPPIFNEEEKKMGKPRWICPFHDKGCKCGENHDFQKRKSLHRHLVDTHDVQTLESDGTEIPKYVYKCWDSPLCLDKCKGFHDITNYKRHLKLMHNMREPKLINGKWIDVCCTGRELQPNYNISDPQEDPNKCVCGKHHRIEKRAYTYRKRKRAKE